MNNFNNLLSLSAQSVIIFSKNDTDFLINIVSNNLNTNKGDTLYFEPSMGVEELRNILSKFFLKPISGSERVLFVDRADGLNKEQSNTLLKTIEEPPEHGRVVLFAHNKAKILETILSRTHQIYLGNNKIDARSELIDDFDKLSFGSYTKKIKSIERQEAIDLVGGAIEHLRRREGLVHKVGLYEKLCKSLVKLDSSNVSHKLVLESLFIHNRLGQ